MRTLLPFLVIATLLAGCRSQNEPLPNIIIMFTDDQGYGDVGVYGAQGFETPHLDRLAQEGVRFTNFYMPAAVCTPSRAALLTGSYPKRLGLHEAVIFPFSEHGLNPSEETLPELLAPAGYRTGMIGKWHLGHRPEWMPNAQGFETFFGVPYSNDMDSYLYRNPPFQSPPLPLMGNESLLESGPDQRYLTKRYTDQAIGFIERHSDEPFFLYIAHNMPHVPLFASEDWEGSSERGLYGDVIQEIDWSVGEVMQALVDAGIDDRTIVLFTSDNGATVGENIGSNAPLRGGKASTWEGGFRVPLIARWPERIPAGSVSHGLSTAMDLLPTLVDWAGAEMPQETIDGLNIGDLFLQPGASKSARTELLYYARNGELEAIRAGDWKLHIDKTRGWPGDSAFPVSLYDLSEDPGEARNLADENQEIVETLTDRMWASDSVLTSQMRPAAQTP